MAGRSRVDSDMAGCHPIEAIWVRVEKEAQVSEWSFVPDQWV